jgi:nitrilase
MQTVNSPFKVAVVQATPALMDRDATLDRACELILEAGHNGARLVAFPESFVPGYPDWVWSIPAGEQAVLNELSAEFLANAVTIPSDPLDKLCRIARRARTYVVLGLSECSVADSGSILYDTLVYIDADGQLLGRHRKLVPTGGERLVWAQGDGSTLSGFNTPLGKIGGLLGWENYMPLARYAMAAGGVQVLVAATRDRGEPWMSTLRHIAKEGRMLVLGACTLPDRAESVNTGGSAIVNPEGEFITGPVTAKEEILYAEIDPKEMRGPKWMLDAAGHYARPDVFQLTINRRPPGMVYQDDAARDSQEIDAPGDSERGI